MTNTDSKHEHKYTEELEITSIIRDYSMGEDMAVITAKDTLKQRKCKCGKVLTYDLERSKS